MFTPVVHARKSPLVEFHAVDAQQLRLSTDSLPLRLPERLGAGRDGIPHASERPKVD